MLSIPSIIYYNYPVVIKQYSTIDPKTDLGVQRDLFSFANIFISNASNILDLMGGSGLSSVPFQETGYTNITIADSPEGMLKLAKERGLENVVNTNLNSNALPFAENSFDAVICNQGIYYLRKKYLEDNVFNEISRVLKDGGLFIFNNIDELNPNHETITDSQGDTVIVGEDLIPTTFIHDHTYLIAQMAKHNLKHFYENPVRITQLDNEQYETGIAYAFQKSLYNGLQNLL